MTSERASPHVPLGRLRGGGRGRHRRRDPPLPARPGSLAAARQHRREPPPPGADRPADDPRRLARPRAPGPTTAAAPSRSCPVSWTTAIDLLSRRAPPRLRRATAARPSTAARTAGRAPAASTTRRASSTASSTASAASSAGEHTLQQRRADRDHAARRRRHARVPGPGDRVVGARAAHRAVRLLRRHPDQEHDGEPRRRQPAPPRGTTCARRRPAGAEFVLLSPLRDDLPEFVERRVAPDRAGHRRRRDARPRVTSWSTRSLRPRVPRALLRRASTASSATSSARRTARPKTPEWAERLSGIPAATIRALARRMAAKRTLINVNWSLQRVEHGEQAPWMAVTLAAMLGQIGLPGGGFGQRLRLDGLHRPGAAPRASPPPCRRAEPGARLHPVRARRGHAAPSGRAVRLRRPAAHLSRHPPRLLVRRQSVPPPSGPRPAAPRARRARTRSSCTTRSGRRWRATPTSCCRRR